MYCVWCTNEAADNYNPTANNEDGSCIISLQEFTTCESGEVGVFVSMQYTDINLPAGEASWDIQDGDGNVLEDLDYLPIASNIIYTSNEICLPGGVLYI